MAMEPPLGDGFEGGYRVGLKKGMLITLEGNEGCGKSTQIRLLHRFLKTKGIPVYSTREPGGTRVGDAIRGVLLDSANKKMTGECETLLYMAARAQLVQEVILPKLKAGFVVLCDRWLDATLAYQGYGAGVDVDWIERLGIKATGGIKPTVTLFLDLPLLTGLRRAKSHKAADRMEKKDIVFHKKVRRGYEVIAQKEPKRFRWIPISENESISAVHEKVKKAIAVVLSRVC